MPKKINEDSTNLKKEKEKTKASTTKKATKTAATKATTAKKATKVSTAKATTAKKATKTATVKATKPAIVKEATKKAAKTSATKATTAKKATKVSTAKTTTAKKAAKTSEAKTTTAKKATRVSTAKTATAKKTAKSATVKKTTKAKAKKATTKKVAKTKAVKNNLKFEVVEYYDLPYRYNQTLVKVLYQTPNILFIYWDISDDDRKKFISQYGDNFFNDTTPVLIVHNDTLHYSFEIEINDFANSWYLHVNDSNCKYAVELGRRPKQHRDINIPNNYLYVTYSNEIESPNDHVLFDKNLDSVYFKDVKTNIISKKSITSLSFLRNMGKIYSLFDLQTNFNNDKWLDNNYLSLNLNNPSSANPTSTFR